MAPRDQRVIPKACANCRRKKVRCDLTKPACRNCTQVYNVECIYDASLSYRSAEVLLARVSKAEGLLEMLVEDPTSLPTVLSQWQSSRSMHDKAQLSSERISDHAMPTDFIESDLPVSPASSKRPRLKSTSTNASDVAFNASAHPSLPGFRKSSTDTDIDEQMRFIRQLPVNLIDHLQYIHWTWQWPLHCFADRDATIQDLAHIQTEMPRYATPLLLLTMLAHAARFSNRVVVQTSSSTDQFKMGGIFLTRAKHLLYKQIDLPPTLSDTAAILMMASRQVACGEFTQAWVYSGMAIRMIEDMGIPAMAVSIASSPDQAEALQDPETRRAWRLYWSSFTFDKTVAFGLGRKPALSWPGEIQGVWIGQPSREASPSWPECSQASTVHDPSGLKIPVMAANTEVAEMSSDKPVLGRTAHYPYETFGHWCSLSCLLGEVLEQSQRSNIQTSDSDYRSSLSRLRFRLSEWRRKLPNHIAISDPRLEMVSRPPNIVSLNMIYQVCRILCHSSGRSGPAASASMRIDNLVDSSSPTQPQIIDDRIRNAEVCRAAAIEIHALLEMWSRSFAFDRMTWLIGCCVYTGAAVNAQDVRHPNMDVARQAAFRLSFASYALGISASFTPGIRKSTSALLEFAERINAEHRIRSYSLSTTDSFQPQNTSEQFSPSVQSTSPWNFSETSANDFEPGRASSIPKEKYKGQSRNLKSKSGALQQDDSSQIGRINVAHSHSAVQSQQDWNMGTVDLDAMFKEVLEAEIAHHTHAPVNDAALQPMNAQANQDLALAASTDNVPPPNVSDADTISWEDIMGSSHWNLDALINDKDLLDALGTLPLYPGDQL